MPAAVLRVRKRQSQVQAAGDCEKQAVLTDCPESPMLCQVCAAPMSEALRKERNVSCGDYFEGRRLFPGDAGDLALWACAGCGFAAFADMLSWPAERFRRDIYNDGYPLCDPPFLGERPDRLARWLAGWIGGASLLDFGGGEGRLARRLREAGCDALSFDPFYQDNPPPAGRFDIVTAFEVIEHVPDQTALLADLASLCAETGVMVVSTLLQDQPPTDDWWYASARNGHVCFHTARSLALWAGRAGFEVASRGEVHFLARDRSLLARFNAFAPVEVSGRPGFRFARKWRELAAIGN